MLSGSSKQWRRQQMSDPYVVRAGAEGYASRATFKLEQIVKKHKFIRELLASTPVVVDLGAAPGGWSQYLLRKYKNITLVAVDRIDLALPPEALSIKADIEQIGLEQEILRHFHSKYHERADLVLSDCSPNLSGHRSTDQARSEQLALAAFYLAQKLLARGGCFLVKLRQGGTKEIEPLMKNNFEKIFYQKPPASRSKSAEVYLVGKGFNGE